jgi:hypothetical protein
MTHNHTCIYCTRTSKCTNIECSDPFYEAIECKYCCYGKREVSTENPTD